MPGGAAGVPDSVREGANGRTKKRAADPHSPQHVFFSGGNDSDSSGPPKETATTATAPVPANHLYERAIQVALSASAHVGHLRLDFIDATRGSNPEPEPKLNSSSPYVFIQATRKGWSGTIEIDPEAREISGSNPQLQDYLLGPDRTDSFRGYFVSRFSEPFSSYGVAYGSDCRNGERSGEGEDLGAYARFQSDARRVEVRTGVSS